jgi:hypothetical protein
MTKLDLVLDRVRRLPPERQEAMAVQLAFLLDGEERESLLTDEQWSEIEPTLDEDDQEIPHEQIVTELRAKYPK